MSVSSRVTLETGSRRSIQIMCDTLVEIKQTLSCSHSWNSKEEESNKTIEAMCAPWEEFDKNLCISVPPEMPL